MSMITNSKGFFGDAGPNVQNAIRQDIISGNKGPSWVQILRGQLVENNSLPDNFWSEIDDRVIRVAKEVLVGRDLMDRRNLVQTGGDVGVMISQWADLNDFDAAQQSMSPIGQVNQQRHDFNMNLVPIPFTHLDFTIDLREAMGAQREGFELDTTAAETATRLVAEGLENMRATGSDVTVTINGTQASPAGLTNFADRTTGTFTATWTDGTNREIVGNNSGDVHSMINDALPFRGPFALEVPSNYGSVLGEDYQDDGSRTIRERILAIEEIDEVLVNPELPSSEVVLSQLTRDVQDLRRIEDIQVVNWDISPFQTRFKVFAVEAPRLKSDRNDDAGIVHYTV